MLFFCMICKFTQACCILYFMISISSVLLSLIEWCYLIDCSKCGCGVGMRSHARRLFQYVIVWPERSSWGDHAYAPCGVRGGVVDVIKVHHSYFHIVSLVECKLPGYTQYAVMTVIFYSFYLHE